MDRLVLGAKLVALTVMITIALVVINFGQFQLVAATFGVFSLILLLGALVTFLVKFPIGGVYLILASSFVATTVSFLTCADSSLWALIAILMSGLGIAALHTQWIGENQFSWRLSARSYKITMFGLLLTLVFALAPWTWGGLELLSLPVIFGSFVGVFFLTATLLLIASSSKAFGGEREARMLFFKWSIGLFAFVAILPSQMAFLRGDGAGLSLLIWSIIFVLHIDILFAPTLLFMWTPKAVQERGVGLVVGGNPVEHVYEGSQQIPSLPHAFMSSPQPDEQPILHPISRVDNAQLSLRDSGNHSKVGDKLLPPSLSSLPKVPAVIALPPKEAAVPEPVQEISSAPTQAYAQPSVEEINAYWASYQANQADSSDKR